MTYSTLIVAIGMGYRNAVAGIEKGQVMKPAPGGQLMWRVPYTSSRVRRCG
jgi:hypothetical protein